MLGSNPAPGQADGSWWIDGKNWAGIVVGPSGTGIVGSIASVWNDWFKQMFSQGASTTDLAYALSGNTTVAQNTRLIGDKNLAQQLHDLNATPESNAIDSLAAAPMSLSSFFDPANWSSSGIVVGILAVLALAMIFRGAGR